MKDHNKILKISTKNLSLKDLYAKIDFIIKDIKNYHMNIIIMYQNHVLDLNHFQKIEFLFHLQIQ